MLEFVHVVEELAQDPDLLQDVRLEEEFLAAGARAVEVDGRVDALFGHAALDVVERLGIPLGQPPADVGEVGLELFVRVAVECECQRADVGVDGLFHGRRL